MKKIRILLSIVLLTALTEIGWADNAVDLSKENAELKQRVDRLEKELAELKKIVMQQAKSQAAPAAKQEAAAAPKVEGKPLTMPQLSDTDLQKILAMAQKEGVKKKPVWSDLDIQLYGFIKADASYDSSRSYPGNYVLYLDSEAVNKHDNEFNLTGNETRVGLKINGPESEGVVTSGLLEFDFYGSYAEENKAKIQMRHAYLKIDWPSDHFSILAGQTSDVISPLVPSTLNYTVMWDVGNIGYRRPQIRLTKSYQLEKDTEFKLEGAIARTIGRTSPSGSESGEDAGYPTLQGRTSVTFPWFGYKPTTIGASGHWGKEEYDLSATDDSNKKFDSWSANLDVTQPINEWLTIKAEAFTGVNLNTYFGGIGQGVRNTGTAASPNYDKEIGAKGGWVAANLGPWNKWRFNAGIGIDDVDSGDVNAGDRTLNREIFGNMIYSINKNTDVGLELSQWHTDRKGENATDSIRAQTSFIYKF